jgi:hypothetical protein
MEASAMGIEWAWMIPRPEATRERIEQLIVEQAGEVLPRGSSGYEDFDHLPRPALPPPQGEWMANRLLLDVVDVEWDNCRRVSFIGQCPLLPAEWRLGAYRSFLPDHLEAAVGMWSAQIDRARTAGRQGYAHAWYRYARQRDIAEGWAGLLGHAERLLARGDRRTHPPALISVCERVRALAAGPFSGLPMTPAPLWGQPSYPVPDDEHAYEAACDMLEEWNRLAPAWPVRFLRYPSYEDFVVELASGDRLQDGLGWLWEAVGNGRGLYLWH